MTNSEMSLSYDIVHRVDRWLISERLDTYAVREAVLEVLAQDEEYWADKSLWRAYDEAKRRYPQID